VPVSIERAPARTVDFETLVLRQRVKEVYKLHFADDGEFVSLSVSNSFLLGTDINVSITNSHAHTVTALDSEQQVMVMMMTSVIV